jgi:predicted AlkP superfamily pyrophosphatase or phosphodiesterase
MKTYQRMRSVMAGGSQAIGTALSPASRLLQLAQTTVGIIAILSACLLPQRVAATEATAHPPPLILISLDAFRWDYCELHPNETPHLHRLMREGVHAKALVPMYPSNTFANHYTIVTGLRPSHHGIINNDFFDPRFGAFFHYTIRASVQDERWWGGEPVWVTSIKQGHRACSSFWTGSETKVEGIAPTAWRPYDARVPFERRFDELFEWLHWPETERPAVITFYLEETNSIGHKFGPDSPELTQAIKMQDERLGKILARLEAEKMTANIVVVSDHGMTPISPERVTLLDDFISPTSVQVDFDGPAVGLRPVNGDVAALLGALASIKHANAYRVEELPARFHIDPTNPRNPPVWIVPDEGWEVYFRSKFELYRGKFNHGDHGYDPDLKSMQGIFIAWGPGIKAGATIDEVENVHLYNFLCAVAGLKPAPNDGDDRLVRAVLASPQQ